MYGSTLAIFVPYNHKQYNGSFMSHIFSIYSSQQYIKERGSNLDFNNIDCVISILTIAIADAHAYVRHGAGEQK